MKNKSIIIHLLNGVLSKAYIFLYQIPNQLSKKIIHYILLLISLQIIERHYLKADHFSQSL
jgi:hypothetical protein